MTDTRFPVSKDWRERALIDSEKYEAMYARSISNPEEFWREQARRIDWIKRFTKVKNVSWDPDNLHIKWFEDGTLNVSANCIDRHLPKRAKQTAIIWEGDDPKDSRHITYEELHRGLPFRQCAEGAQRQTRRPRHDLSPHDPGSRLCDAGLRAHRRGAFGGVRGLLARQLGWTHPRLRKHDRAHGR